nr:MULTISPECIES: NAD(P)-dependent oxidoreductase [unclassified Sphingomonas]
MATLDADGAVLEVVGEGAIATLIASALGGEPRFSMVGLEGAAAAFVCGKSIDEARREIGGPGPDIIWLGPLSPDAGSQLEHIARSHGRGLLILVLAPTMDGGLMAIASGDAHLQQIAEPVMRDIVTRSFYMGIDIQASSVMAALNAMISAGAAAVTADSGLLADRLGIDRKTLFAALNQSTGGSGATAMREMAKDIAQLCPTSPSIDHYLKYANFHETDAPLGLALAHASFVQGAAS